MIDPPDAVSFQKATRWVRGRNRPVLLTHTKPDGDALGSMAALRLVLRSLGIEADAVLFDEPPARYEFLKPLGGYQLWQRDFTEARLRQADCVVLLDTCAARQIEPAAAWVQTCGLPKLVVDHHVSRDIPTDLSLIDESASAACWVLYEWFESANWPISQDCANALFVGLATDTGWFRHSNTDRGTMAAAGMLIDRGARPHELFDLLYQHESPARFRLKSTAAGRMELLGTGRLAVMTLPKEVFTECEASLADTEDLVNEPLRIASVVVSALLVETGPNEVRIGLRSRAPIPGAVPDVDVAALAGEYGGGGHRRAAGARIQGGLSAVHLQVVERLQRAVADA